MTTTGSTTIRALRVHEHGEPAAVLRVEDDVVLPEPGPGEVRIAVEATALNFADRLLCTGEYQEHPSLPFTPGMECAGRVVAVGPDARQPIGTRVLGSPLLPYGGLASECLALTSDVFPIPDELPAPVAAAMHVTYQTGWIALHRRARLRRGEVLLVHAGAGGVGSAAIQLGAAAGATVIASAGGPEKAALCRELGADVALDYRSDDIAAAVLDLTEGRGADVIFDSVGGDTFVASTKCIAWEGRILVIGAAAGRYAEARTNHVLVKNYSVVGVHWGGYRTRDPELLAGAHVDLMRLWSEGAIAPHVSAELTLADAPAALDRLAGGGTTGKLVVLP